LYATQLKRLMWLRLLMVTTLLLSAAYVEAGSESPQPFNALYFLIAATYLLTILYALALRRFPERIRPQAAVQVLVDLVLVTSLVYYIGRGGGAGAGFALLYPLSVLSGSVLLLRRQAVEVAAAATLLYAGVLCLVRWRAIPPAGLIDVLTLPSKQLVFAVFVTAIVCGAVALTGAHFADSLRSTGRQLEQAVDEVAALKEVNQIVVQSLQSGVLILGSDGRVRHLNAFGASILGLAAESASGQPVRQVLGGALDAESLRARVARREWSRFEVNFRRSDGRELPIGASVAPLVTQAHEPGGGYLLVFQDITEVRRLEQQARDNEKLAAIGEVAARLAHEIRNPLGAISGSAQVLLADADMSEDQVRLLSIITKESRRLSDNLNQFLQQIRTPTRPLAPIDLGPIIEEALTLLRNAPEVSAVHEVRFERDSGPHLCLADPDRITQVLWNLARNGIEAMPRGGVLAVSLRATADRVLLALQDDGRGIGSNDLQGFQPAAGGGLGLAIVYQIVREHHGDIGIHPVPPRGTRVEVRLPRLTVETVA
jgi:two-component system, NtrC family, sensor histidine kinase PilS